MLVLSRKVGETILINGNIRLTILSVRSNHIRLGIIAPGDVPIFREELLREPPPEALRRSQATPVAAS